MESNPAVKSGLLNVVIDKDFKEISALQETFPADVKIKICLFHAIQALQREVSSDSYNLNKDLRKKLKDFFSMLANSKNEDEYNLYYSEFCNILNSSEEGKLFLNYWNWHESDKRKLWVSYLIPEGLVVNLTNNRLESLHGTLKSIVTRNFKVDELIQQLLNILKSLETESSHFLIRLHSGGKYNIPKDMQELEIFSKMYTPFAFGFIKKQFEISLRNEYSHAG
jgi:hypothetical protein